MPPFYYYGREYWEISNVPWEDRLVYAGILKGRSMLQFEFKSFKTGFRYFFLAKDFDALVKSGKLGTIIVEGKCFSAVTGTFEFVKKGSSYGIKLVE